MTCVKLLPEPLAEPKLPHIPPVGVNSRNLPCESALRSSLLRFSGNPKEETAIIMESAVDMLRNNCTPESLVRTIITAVGTAVDDPRKAVLDFMVQSWCWARDHKSSIDSPIAAYLQTKLVREYTQRYNRN